MNLDKYGNYSWTTIYSSPSVEALTELWEAMRTVLGVDEQLDDIFYYNVFCKDVTYANYDAWEDMIALGYDTPLILTQDCTKTKERLSYVQFLMADIMRGDVEKPDWMEYIEMHAVCNEFDSQPSTFLYIIPKDEKYQVLADKLIEFLYSPNLVITMVGCQETWQDLVKQKHFRNE